MRWVFAQGAVANAVGSQIINVFIGLGLPYAIAGPITFYDVVCFSSLIRTHLTKQLSICQQPDWLLHVCLTSSLADWTGLQVAAS